MGQLIQKWNELLKEMEQKGIKIQPGMLPVIETQFYAGATAVFSILCEEDTSKTQDDFIRVMEGIREDIETYRSRRMSEYRNFKGKPS